MGSYISPHSHLLADRIDNNALADKFIFINPVTQKPIKMHRR